MSVVQRVDRYQQSHPKLGLPLGVVYKFFDDQGPYLAALITYYGFLSLFPLLLLLTTILNFTLSGDPELQQRVLQSTLGQFPVIGNELSTKDGVSGSGVALLIGILGTIYGGLGVAQAAQNAMNTIWRVPRNSRPNPIKSRLRSLLLLNVVGLAVAGTTVLSALGFNSKSFGADVSTGLQTLLVIVSLVVNAGVFTLGFHVATARRLTWQQTVPGAVISALAWQMLQFGGTAFIASVVKHASVVNSVFALVLGLIAWIYVEAVVVVLAVEYNAVRSLRLYPRALLTPFTDNVVLTKADEAAYRGQALAARLKGFQDIEVNFDKPVRKPPPPEPKEQPGAKPAAGQPRPAAEEASAVEPIEHPATSVGPAPAEEAALTEQAANKPAASGEPAASAEAAASGEPGEH